MTIQCGGLERAGATTHEKAIKIFFIYLFFIIIYVTECNSNQWSLNINELAIVNSANGTGGRVLQCLTNKFDEGPSILLIIEQFDRRTSCCTRCTSREITREFLWTIVLWLHWDSSFSRSDTLTLSCIVWPTAFLLYLVLIIIHFVSSVCRTSINSTQSWTICVLRYVVYCCFFYLCFSVSRIASDWSCVLFLW